jgi:hypothetical protein
MIKLELTTLGSLLSNFLTLDRQVKCTYRTYSMLLKFFLCTIYKTSVSTGFAKQIMPILRILCYNDSLITWMVVSITTAKFKPLILSMSRFALSYTANMSILVILYDLGLLLAQFCYIIVYIRMVGSCVQIADQCAPWKILSGVQNLVLHALQF